MRGTRGRAVSCFVLLLLVLVGSAFADTVHMKFLGHGGTKNDPYYPWYFQVNGVNTTLMCDTYNNQNFKGETWDANVTNILSGQGLFGNKLLEYKASAVVYSWLLFQGANAHDAQWAIWALLTPGAMNGKGWDSGALALYNAALALAPKLPTSFFAPYFLYTPIKGTQSGHHGLPQEFIGYNPNMVVPEPGTMAMLGAGILVLAGAIRKKSLRP